MGTKKVFSDCEIVKAEPRDINQKIADEQKMLDSLPSDEITQSEMNKLVNMSIAMSQKMLKSKKVPMVEKMKFAGSIVTKAMSKEMFMVHDVGDNFLDIIKQAHELREKEMGNG